MSETLRLAVPNKGRLKDSSIARLKEAGLDFEQTDRALHAQVRNVDMELLFVRTEDIPEMIADQVADLGITGIDLLAENGTDLPVLAELGYGYCKLVAAVPRVSEVEKLEDLAGLKVATAHPHATRTFFADRKIDVTIIPLRGSVEVAPKLGLSDAIVDLVSTGSTMMVNGLRPVDTLLSSQAVLATSPEAQAGRRDELDRVTTALNAVTQGRKKRYLLLNAPVDAIDAIAAVMPGMGAPTITPLADSAMVSIASVVDSDAVWNLLPELKACGGRDIVVLPVGQLIP